MELLLYQIHPQLIPKFHHSQVTEFDQDLEHNPNHKVVLLFHFLGYFIFCL